MTGKEFRESRGMVDPSNHKEGTTGNMEPPQQETPPGNPDGDMKGLAAMDKRALLAFIGKRKLFDNSYKSLEPAAIVPLVLVNVRNKIVEAGLKTADEIAAIGEGELFALFDSIGKEK